MKSKILLCLLNYYKERWNIDGTDNFCKKYLLQGTTARTYLQSLPEVHPKDWLVSWSVTRIYSEKSCNFFKIPHIRHNATVHTTEILKDE